MGLKCDMKSAMKQRFRVKWKSLPNQIKTCQYISLLSSDQPPYILFPRTAIFTAQLFADDQSSQIIRKPIT
jgi:hypothetical protein